MLRRARIDIPGLLQHVIVWGIEKRKIFRDDHDRGMFVARFSSLLEETGTDSFVKAIKQGRPLRGSLAAAQLIEKLGGEVVEMAFIVNLPDVGGEKKLNDKGYATYSLTEFEGD